MNNNNENNNENDITIHLYQNFDDIDDFKEITTNIYDAGRVLYEQEKLGWQLDPDEHNIADQIYLLSLKSDYLYSNIIDILSEIKSNFDEDE